MIRLLAIVPVVAGIAWLVWRSRPRPPMRVGPDTLRRLRRGEDGP